MSIFRSINGWGVLSAKPKLWPSPIGGIRPGPVWVVLSWFMRQYAALVEPIDPKQSGCFNRRKARGSKKWSNHASATAVDLNWSKHPYKKLGTFTAHQMGHLLSIISQAGGVIRWGRLFADEMHFEINASPAKVEKFATKLLQRELIRHGHSCGKAGADGLRGPATKAALRAFQRAHGLKADAIDGPTTWAALIK